MSKIHSAFEAVLADFLKCNAITKLSRGELTVDHYKSILREIYYYSREDPQIQAVATAYFRGADREFVKPFLRHAVAEVGHDEMALADLAVLGEDVTNIPNHMPLPETLALTAFPYYQIQYLNPVGYLGYLYFLEFLPTSSGGMLAEGLLAAGVPQQALSFLAEHTTVDVSHNALMQKYLANLVRNEADETAVIYAMQSTAVYYAGMLDAAVRTVDADLQLADHTALARCA